MDILGKPISIRNRTIYLLSWWSDGRIEYLNERGWNKYQSFNIIPEASYRDKTYRTRAERYHMVMPQLKYAVLTNEELRQLINDTSRS